MDENYPILSQLHKVENYQQWVHQPSKTKQRYILFGNPILETLSKTHWYYIPMCYLPICCYFITLAYDRCSHYAIIMGLMYGVYLWGLTEYSMHRFVFHADITEYPFTVFHFLFHGIHHKTPRDSERLVFPPLWGMLFVLLPVFACLKYIYQFHAYSISTGFILGYLIYDLSHYYFHHGNKLFFKTLRKNHLHHHFGKEKSNFGVSTIASHLDYIFQTNATLD
ncbi:MAG: sterol desaturase family protein [Candidatus Aquicultor sp.]